MEERERKWKEGKGGERQGKEGKSIWREGVNKLYIIINKILRNNNSNKMIR